MVILHVAAECFPVAKAGGLGDVVGALPKYQNRLGVTSKVVIPMYRTPFLYQEEWELVHEGSQFLQEHFFKYSVIREKSNKLGFDLYLIDINGLLDREKVYGYPDDVERFLAFQLSVCDWLFSWSQLPDIVHCHDHHCGLVPFIMTQANQFRSRLQAIPTVFTVHNAQYQGAFDWSKQAILPPHDSWKCNLLDWHGQINPLAAAIKTAWRVTTVSHSYLTELMDNAGGLEKLFQTEVEKCTGILNGIDTEIWDPSSDPYLLYHYSLQSMIEGKRKNKEEICKEFGMDPSLPLFSFVGRLVGEKAADLLPIAIQDALLHNPSRANYIVLGTGEKETEYQLQELRNIAGGFYNCYIGYQEALSHSLYAGSDFILMPSRVEPCGLNQLYAMRFGTMPIVRRVGGLKDTVIDLGDSGGYGICFDQPSVWDITYSIRRAINLYYDNLKDYHNYCSKMMQLDFSWDKAAGNYLNLYRTLK
ncbi:MAG: glycogen synthase [Bacteroidota bacterium]|jgi:starch synthase